VELRRSGEHECYRRGGEGETLHRYFLLRGGYGLAVELEPDNFDPVTASAVTTGEHRAAALRSVQRSIDCNRPRATRMGSRVAVRQRRAAKPKPSSISTALVGVPNARALR
jgi:hypothetical protein